MAGMAPERPCSWPPRRVTLLVSMPPRRTEFLGNLRAALGPVRRRLPLELNLDRVSPRCLAESAVLHAGVLMAMLTFSGIQSDTPIVVENKLPEATVIYYPAQSLPRIEDAGGSVGGSQGTTGGRAAFHPDQTIHVSRAIPLNNIVADAPKLPLPNVPGAAANLLALPAAPASLPVLSAPVELALRESRIARPERLKTNEVPPTDLQLKLQRGQTAANLALASPIVLPVLSAPVELARRESKISRPDQLKPNEVPATALQLKLQRGRAPNLVDTPANVTLAAPPPPRRPNLPKEIAIETANGTSAALQMMPLRALPRAAEADSPSTSNASAEPRPEIVVSAKPGNVVGVPAGGKSGSLAVSPKGNAQPGIGNEGRGASVARGAGPGSGASGDRSGGSTAGMGPGSSSIAKAGVSPEPGPSGAGKGSASIIPGVDIRGGVVTLDSFGPTAVAGRNPSVATPPRKPSPITIVATSRSGGGLPAYGAFKNRTVYTVYVDTTAGEAVLQFAAQDSTSVDSAGLTPPDPLSTQMPRGVAGSGVVFACVLDESGHVQNLRLVSGSSPAPALEEALRRWIFHPALNGGQAIAVDALIGIGVGVGVQ